MRPPPHLLAAWREQFEKGYPNNYLKPLFHFLRPRALPMAMRLSVRPWTVHWSPFPPETHGLAGSAKHRNRRGPPDLLRRGFASIAWRRTTPTRARDVILFLLCYEMDCRWGRRRTLRRCSAHRPLPCRPRQTAGNGAFARRGSRSLSPAWLREHCRRRCARKSIFFLYLQDKNNLCQRVRPPRTRCRRRLRRQPAPRVVGGPPGRHQRGRCPVE